MSGAVKPPVHAGPLFIAARARTEPSYHTQQQVADERATTMFHAVCQKIRGTRNRDCICSVHARYAAADTQHTQARTCSRSIIHIGQTVGLSRPSRHSESIIHTGAFRLSMYPCTFRAGATTLTFCSSRRGSSEHFQTFGVSLSRSKTWYLGRARTAG